MRTDRASFARPLGAILGGVLWGLCFSRHPPAVLGFVGLVPLLLLLSGPRPGLCGFLHGMAAWGVSVPWLVGTLVTFGPLPRLVAVLLVTLLVAFLSLFNCVFARLGASLWRSGTGIALVGLPGLWVALEWLREYIFGGFPWNLAGYAWVNMPGALPLTAFVGTYGLSFLLVAANVALAAALRSRRWEPAALGLMLSLLGFAFGARFAPPAAGTSARLPVRLVQPDIANQVGYDPELAVANYRRLMHLTLASCDHPGALVVWPESAAWPWAYERDAVLRQDIATVAARGCALLFNSPHWDELGGEEAAVYNSIFLIAAESGRERLLGRYDKRRLVPWGEYVPLGRILPFVGHLARSAGQFSAGRRNVLLPWGEERLGPSICYEVIFPGQVAAAVHAGATMLVTVTNDAWYGDTFAPWQHLRAARFRAAENGRPMLRAAITGISAVIGPRGELVSMLGVGDEGVVRVAIGGRRELTPYTRLPWGVPLLSLLVAVGLIWWCRRATTGAGAPARPSSERGV